MSEVVMNAKTARPGARRLLHTVALLAAWGLSAMAALPFAAQAQSVALSWNRNAETNLTAYVLKYGTTSGSYTGQVSVAANLLTTTVNSVVLSRTQSFAHCSRWLLSG